MNFIRRGTGKPLLLVHGLGGSWQSWSTILDGLAAERDVIAVDLPGFGDTPPLLGETSIATLADALTAFLTERELIGIDAVGSSMGARLVLELARRGVVGATVALDPGGFWKGWERAFFGVTIGASIRLVRILKGALPAITASAVGRTLLFAQFSARPWNVPAAVALTELRTFVATPVFDEVLMSLARGPGQRGIPRGAARAPIVIAWGRADRVCLPVQAKRAMKRFPGALLHWFEVCGHFPQWDAPQATIRLILQTTR